MPDDTATPTPTPPPEPAAAPEPLGGEEEKELSRALIRMLMLHLTDKDIQQMLTEIVKSRANHILNTASDKGFADMSLMLCGITKHQVLTVRRWLELFAVPKVLTAYAEFLEQAKKSENPAAGVDGTFQQ